MLELEPILGYLNFAEGRPDPRFQRQLNDAYAHFADAGSATPGGGTPWIDLRQALQSTLVSAKAAGKAAFAESVQAEATIGLVFDQVIPAYRQHHVDLLFHLTDADFHQPFFLARVCEAVLTQGPCWEEKERIVAGALVKLNDYVGHRPLPILETRPQGEPYERERVRPIPSSVCAAISKAFAIKS